MLRSLKHNLVRLTDFDGRETRGQFWPWVGCVFALAFIGYGIVFGSMMKATVSKMQRFATDHPDQATVVSSPGSYSISIEGSHPELMPQFGSLFPLVGGLIVVLVVLLAAAVSRRLHDRGRSALWGLSPLPFVAFAMVGMNVLFGQLGSGTEPDIRLFFAIFLNNMFYLAVLLALVIQLSGAGSPEVNRFGPPVR